MHEQLELGGGVAIAVLFSAVAGLAAIQRMRQRFRSRHATPSRAARLQPRLTIQRVAVWQGTLVALLWVLFHFGFWTPASVGFSSRESQPMAFLAGLLVYGALVTAYGLVLRTLSAGEQTTLAAFRRMARQIPTTRGARCAVVAMICLANPVTEELMFRGLLVHQWALLASHVWGVFAIGALVNSLNHADQGWRAAPFHLVFYAVALGLLYSPYGMSAVIGLHFVGDALPFLGFPERLREYRRSRRRARRLRRA